VSNYQDESDELAGCVLAIIGLLIGLLTAIIVFSSTGEHPRLPNIPEPGPDYRRPGVHLPPPLAMAGVGILSLIAAGGFVDQPDGAGAAALFLRAGLVFLGAALAKSNQAQEQKPLGEADIPTTFVSRRGSILSRCPARASGSRRLPGGLWNSYFRQCLLPCCESWPSSTG
jgi:hypothetical protein